MGTHTIKGLRQEFKDVGKFHTPPELAKALYDLIPPNPRDVYDPTCGAGALLAQFGDDVPKYGQDIDQEALDDARLIPNFHGHHGDVLTDPAWLDRRFHAIVANPPFSIKWTPQADERFFGLPAIPTKSRADYAFLAHIIHMLGDDGTAVVLSFPGVLYRGQREGKIRRWMVEENLVDKVIHVPGNTFTDTSIATAILVLRKNRTTTDVTFEDRETGVEATASLDEIRANDFMLSVNLYAAEPEPEEEKVDPWELQQQARRGFLRQLRKDMQFDQWVCRVEGWDFEEFRAQIIQEAQQV